MSVTGHKSANSLTVYQNIDEQKKIEMGRSVGQHIASLGQEMVRYSGSRSGSRTIDNELENLHLEDWNFDVDFPHTTAIRPQPQQSLSTGFPQGMFNNCQIKSLTIQLPGQ